MAEALALGIVSEIHARERLNGRAREIAAGLALRDHIFLRHTRSVLVQRLRKAVADLLPLGLHAEFAAAMADSALPRADGISWDNDADWPSQRPRWRSTGSTIRIGTKVQIR